MWKMIQFIKKDYQPDGDVARTVESAWDEARTKSGLSQLQVEMVLSSCEKSVMIHELMMIMGLKNRSKFREKYITPLLEEDILAMTIPEKPTSSRQQYSLTEKGKRLLADIRKKS